MAYTNYHSHCYFCDGKDSPEAYLQEALRLGMPAYGISSHAPLPYELSWPMKDTDSEAYVREIEQLKGQYTGLIEVYRGLEVDFIPHVAGPSLVKDTFLLDYTVGSVHFVDFFANGYPWEIDGRHQVFLRGLAEIFTNDTEAAIRRYYALIRQMVRDDPPDIVGHLDKIKIQSEGGQLFDEHSEWYREEIDKTLNTIADAGLIVEVNTRGMGKQLTSEPYPSYWILERMRERNIPIMINSDAHHPREIITHFPEVAERLKKIGYEQVRVLYQQEWQDVSFSERGIFV